MSKGTIICLCDFTGVMAEPWVEAGYRAVLVDPQHLETSIDGPVERISATILDAMPRLSQIIRTENIVMVIGFPPCTHVAVSGSRWFEAKRAKDPHFQAKAALVAEQCRMIGMVTGCPWAFENPVSVFSSIFGSADYTFHPYQFTGLCADDNYTKQTCLWTGNGFKAPAEYIHPQVAQAIERVKQNFGRMVPKKKALEVFNFHGENLIADWYPDNRIHECPPSDERANIRSATPLGFAKAVFLSNAPHLNKKRESA
ncbi:dcm methylase [Klebsiella pneumoniae]|nr:dcm methylase [Klebsiella pneumoniae]HBS1314812.1 dcm methylase [Klebsiella pneumoniae]HBS7058227.1 dcm methylase [Klebsiella pneumoniae]